MSDDHDHRLDWLRSQMATAQEQFRRGEGFEFTDEFLAELDLEVDERLRLLDEQDLHLQRVRESIAEGVHAIQSGEGIELTLELMDELSRQAEE